MQGFGKKILMLAILLVSNSGFAAEQITSESEPSSLQLLTDVNPLRNLGKNTVLLKGDNQALYNLIGCPSNKPIAAFLNTGSPESENWLEKNCKAAVLGNTEDMLYIALLYRQGRSFPQNNTEALNWYKKAAGSGSVKAMRTLALIYDEGEIVTRNDIEAASWWYQAADLGDVDAMVVIGTRYLKGQGVEQSDIEAMNWWRKAAGAKLLTWGVIRRCPGLVPCI